MVVLWVHLYCCIPYREEGQDYADRRQEQEEDDGGQAEVFTGRAPLGYVLPDLGHDCVT